VDVRKALFRRGRRGALEIGLVGLICALAAGAVIGSGLAQTVLATPSPLTWLRNSKGQVVQVNPETGTMLQRLQIGDPGDPLKVVQDGTRLVVTNLANGTVTVVDLSLLQVAGTRQGDPDGVKVVLAGGQIYLADKRTGQIETLDPLTAATVGQPYRAAAPLTDVVADSTGALWALTTGGRLVTLHWSTTSRVFAEEQRRDLPGAGPGTALVAHQQGITAVTPAGQAIQVGTGQDRTIQVGGLTPPLAAADESPARLVPISSIGDGNVHLVRDNGAVTVDGPPLGCPKPDKPAVYRDRVYVPCRGDRKVIVLDQDGHRLEPDLTTTGDAELVLNAGLLFVNVPTAKTSLVVKPDGTTQPITTDDPSVTINDPNARPTALPSGLGIRPPKPRQPADKQGQNPTKAPAAKKPGQQTAAQPQPGPTSSGTPGGPAADPGSSGGPGVSPSGDGSPSPDPETTILDQSPTPDTESPSPDPPSPSPSPTPSDADYTPNGVDASAGPASSVLVFWTPPRITPDSYEIVREDTREVVASPPVGADQARIAGLAGQQVRFRVVAVTGGRRYPSPLSPPVSPIPLPDAPTVSMQLVALSPTSFTVRVTVNVAGPATSYGVSVTVNGRVQNRTDLPPSSPTSDFTFPCTGPGDPCLTGGSVTANASVTSEGGLGPPGAATLTIPGPPGFAFGQAFMYVSRGGKCLDVDLRIHTCTGSAGQLWVHNGDRSWIRNQSNNRCLAVNDAIHLAGDGCTDDPKKFTRINPVGNEALLFASIGGECVRIIGSPDQEGAPVSDPKNCSDAPTERWTAWRQQGGVPLTASAQPASFTPSSTGDNGAQGGLGEESAVALLLLPLAAGLVRQRQRRRHAR
jgi:hypothetical protein